MQTHRFMQRAIRATLNWMDEAFGVSKALTWIDGGRGWFPVKESFPGAWQKNAEVNFDSVISHHAVFACVTLVASDASKLRVKLVERDSSMVWTEVENSAYSPVLRKPNHYQTRIQFWECYFLSKLMRGNTYVLLQRDNRNVVKAMYVLHPDRVRPMMSDSGDLFYELHADKVSGIQADVIVPASEIIHDRFNCVFDHSLVGVSPIFAAGLAATQGLSIQKNATKFFDNAAMPGGVLTAPGNIDDKDVERIRDLWSEKFGGANRGRLAVLGSGMKFERMVMTSVESQMIEQLKWSGEMVCSAFHIPPYKIGLGPMPTVNNVQSLNLEYYTQCLQVLIEAAEVCLDEALGLVPTLGTEFDLDGLLRMDSITQMDVIEKAKNVMTLDERRRRIDLRAVKGGNTIYMQQQDHSLEAIAALDAQLIEQASKPAPDPNAAPPMSADDQAKALESSLYRDLGISVH